MPKRNRVFPLVRRSGSRKERGPDELDRYRREVDLVALAFSFGYRERDGGARRAAAPPGTVMLRHPATADELVIWRDAEGVWRYSSSADRLYGRTVVEFMLQRRRLGLGHVRKDLRWWMRERAARVRVRGS